MPIVMTSAFFEEITGRRAHAVAQAGGGNGFFRNGFNGRQIEAGAFQVWMPFGHFDGEQTGRTTDVAERFVFGEIELVGERFEVDARKAGHGVEEDFKADRIFVERLKNSFLAVFLFVLRFAGAQRFGQVIPVFEQAHVEHGENAADVARAFFVEEESTVGRVEILCLRAVALALKKLHGDECVEKIRDAARMKF